jgi:hypothetical protein
MKAHELTVGDHIRVYGEILATRYDEDKRKTILTFVGGEVEFHPNSKVQVSYVKMK